MKAVLTISLLCISNIFMTLAWYGHLKFKDMEWSRSLGLITIILISWGIAMFEYIFQVPANKYGFKGNGGPFSLLELKMIQEALSIGIFLIFTLFFFRNEKIAWNHLVGFGFLMLAVFFVFLKKMKYYREEIIC